MKNVILLSSILDCDSYKTSHWKQYPQGTTAMYSYLESRGGKYNKTVMFGLQYYLKKYLTQRITIADVEEAKEICELHGVPFNYEGWMYVATTLKGKLPLKIKAVPEGYVIPVKNILMSVESTDPTVFWIVSWYETLMLRLWYTITVATHSYHIKQLMLPYYEKSSDDPQGDIVWKMHDFGSRGVTCQEQAILGGMAHLINFLGTDTLAGIWGARKFYDEKIAGYSIAASEHSTMTMKGKDGEVEQLSRMIDQYGDQNIFACVSDQYDFFNACRNIWGGVLRDKVLAMKAMLVVRPDSGDPVECIVEGLKIFEEKFGCSINSKGYKVINKIRMIQGDGINENDVKNILEAVLKAGYSATNVGFGMGGGLLQKDINRDTQKMAFKCSWAMINGEQVNVYKDPITDNGKKSKKGKLMLALITDNQVRTLPEGTSDIDLLQTIFENGEIKNYTTFNEIRNNALTHVYEQYIGFVDRDCY